jgi:hypothetical protein
LVTGAIQDLAEPKGKAEVAVDHQKARSHGVGAPASNPEASGYLYLQSRAGKRE